MAGSWVVWDCDEVLAQPPLEGFHMLLFGGSDVFEFSKVPWKRVVEACTVAEEARCSGLPDPARAAPAVCGFSAEFYSQAVGEARDARVVSEADDDLVNGQYQVALSMSLKAEDFERAYPFRVRLSTNWDVKGGVVFLKGGESLAESSLHSIRFIWRWSEGHQI